MGSLKRFAVLSSMAVAVLASPAGIGAASADTIDLGAGGLLSNVASRNASTHSNQCGSSRVGLLNDRSCVTRQNSHHNKNRQVTGPSGGLLSNIDSRNASGSSNNCGTDTVGILNHTTCVTEEK
ncbi:hypothetical protein LE181_03965 [Streptomyces sp. SCA3-4]|uniref:hypothetical protein n=1 Tax=Streptomyces sichuanensis TaxID=2871810 RepID=UPI001CE2EB5F|nr:hypothetical protein [Streptomyces sichuanensis]MCA6091326.1 hypothetical protein [Streptomyces sichuanensis]